MNTGIMEQMQIVLVGLKNINGVTDKRFTVFVWVRIIHWMYLTYTSVSCEFYNQCHGFLYKQLSTSSCIKIWLTLRLKSIKPEEGVTFIL